VTRPVRRLEDLALVAVDLRRAGELLLHPCHCSQSWHRWRTGVDEWVECVNGQVFDPDTGNLRDCSLCKPHSLGEHIDRAAKTMQPGVRAHATDMVRTGPSHEGDTDDAGYVEPPIDLTVLAHARWRSKLALAWEACLEVIDDIQALRPDRATEHVDSTATDEDWCRSCLRIGQCQPRSRGDFCDFCYRFNLATTKLPPVWLIKVHHERGKVTGREMDQAIREVRPKKKAKRKKAG
jgi:hypothetical protein